MKVIIAEGRYTGSISIPKEILKKLPKDVTLAATIQYLNAIPAISKQLAEYGIKATLFKGIHSKYPSQIVGCDIVQPFWEAALYIGDGLFHPKTLVLKGNKPVHCYSPETGEYRLVTRKDVEDILFRHNAARVKFLEAHTIGVLVTTKCGQNNMKAALALKKHLFGKKDVMIFLTDALDWSDLENYPFVDMWINTMCPRISYDDQPRFRKMVLDLADAIETLKHADPSFTYESPLAGRA